MLCTIQSFALSPTSKIPSWTAIFVNALTELTCGNKEFIFFAVIFRPMHRLLNDVAHY